MAVRYGDNPHLMSKAIFFDNEARSVVVNKESDSVDFSYFIDRDSLIPAVYINCVDGAVEVDKIIGTTGSFSNLYYDSGNFNFASMASASIGRIRSNTIKSTDVSFTNVTCTVVRCNTAYIGNFNTRMVSCSTIHGQYVDFYHTTTEYLKGEYATLTNLSASYVSAAYFSAEELNITFIYANTMQTPLLKAQLVSCTSNIGSLSSFVISRSATAYSTDLYTNFASLTTILGTRSSFYGHVGILGSFNTIDVTQLNASYASMVTSKASYASFVTVHAHSGDIITTSVSLSRGHYASFTLFRGDSVKTTLVSGTHFKGVTASFGTITSSVINSDIGNFTTIHGNIASISTGTIGELYSSYASIVDAAINNISGGTSNFSMTYGAYASFLYTIKAYSAVFSNMTINGLVTVSTINAEYSNISTLTGNYSSFSSINSSNSNLGTISASDASIHDVSVTNISGGTSNFGLVYGTNGSFVNTVRANAAYFSSISVTDVYSSYGSYTTVSSTIGKFSTVSAALHKGSIGNFSTASITLCKGTTSSFTTYKTSTGSFTLSKGTTSSFTAIKGKTLSLANGATSYGGVTASGMVSWPMVPFVHAELASGVTVPSGSFKTIIWGTEIVDRLGNIDNTTGIFTAPAGGVYIISVTITYSDAAPTWALTDVLQLQIINGSNSEIINSTYAKSGAFYQTLHGTHVLALSANDQMYVQLYQNSGVTRTLYNAFSRNELTITKIS